jgi:hypothetical protein
MATDEPNYDLPGQNNESTNADYNDYVMRWGQVVESTDKDPSGAGKCKVFIRELDRHLFGKNGKKGLNEDDFLKNAEDYSQIVDALPWSLPLQPKFLVTNPQVGESVLVIIPDRKNDKLERFYMGPFISQPQYLNNDGKVRGLLTGKRGTFSGLFAYSKAWFDNNGARLGGKLSSSNWSIYGDDPRDPNDIAVNGRGNEDIILRTSKKYDEVLLRVNKYSNKNNKILNLKNPGYISVVSYKDIGGLTPSNVSTPPVAQFESLKNTTSVNVVADRINLISHRGSHKGTPSGGGAIILNSSEPEKQLGMETKFLHPTVYGDVLWEVLKKLQVWVETHKHSGGGVAYTEPVKESETTELLSILNTALGSNPTQKISSDGSKYKIYGGELISNNIKIN